MAFVVLLCIEIEIGCNFIIFVPHSKVNKKENSENEGERTSRLTDGLSSSRLNGGSGAA
jgi:hypothetical protein